MGSVFKCNDNPCCGDPYQCRHATQYDAPSEIFEHPDSVAVDRFAGAMKAKLAKKRAEGRGGWEDKDDCAQEFLCQLLREHVDKGDPVDVANLAMMLHQRDERILPEHTPTAIEASPVVGEIEAVAWEHRAYISGMWGAWLPVARPIDVFREQYAFNLENGTIEVRVLVPAASLASLQSENQALREERDGARKWAYEQRLAKHRSGCACHISDDEKLVSVCNFHKEFVERAEAAESQVQSLTLKLEERDKALEPFAKLADEADAFGHEDDSTCIWRLKASDLRRARALQSGGAEQ